MKQLQTIEKRALLIIEVIDIVTSIAMLRSRKTRSEKEDAALEKLKGDAINKMVQLILPFEPTHGPGIEK